MEDIAFSLDDCEKFSAVEGFQRACCFLDRLCNSEWVLDSTSFPPADVKKFAPPSQPLMDVVRLNKKYGGRVPVMRVIGYFPGLNPTELVEHMVQLKLRMKWDHHYRAFEVIKDVADGPQESLEPLARQGDHHRRSEWLFHIVRSSYLEKFGIAERYFIYTRTIFDHPLPQLRRILPANEADYASAFKVLYRGLVPNKDMPYVTKTDAGKEPTHHVRGMYVEQVRSALAKHLSILKIPSTHVFMHFQDVLLTPVLSYESLQKQLAAFRFGGSALTRELPEELFLPVDAPAAPPSNGAQPSSVAPFRGTLLVMSSANDVQTASLPHWLERVVTSFFCWQSYMYLWETVTSDKQNISFDEPPRCCGS